MTAKTTYTCDLCGKNSDEKMGAGPHVMVTLDGVRQIDRYVLHTKTLTPRDHMCKECIHIFMEGFRSSLNHFIVDRLKVNAANKETDE